ncbi:MAG TPA: NnrU family protein [Burkholderiales bacterium]|nr:NnrU family protein [Burkholderiales bacterium]
MGRFFGFMYGLVAYAMFLAAFLYAVGFIAGAFVPKSLDSGESGDLLTALLINAALLGVFAVQHSVMARPGFKAWWTRFVPASIERSTYVVLSSLALGLLYWQWQPMPEVVWHVDDEAGGISLQILQASGWLLVLASTFAISHFDLFGLRQVYLNLRNQRYVNLPFRIGGLYRIVRHPLMLGFLIAFWATPHMTLGHLVFAIATTAYILIALQLEERDLINHHGDKYREYKSDVPMLLPLPREKSRPAGMLKEI